MMLRRFSMLVLVSFCFIAVDFTEAEAARRRGWFRKSRTNQSQRYTRARSYSQSKSKSQKLHMTHSRSAILDGFFGPYPGAEGHDGSWYVGK